MSREVVSFSFELASHVEIVSFAPQGGAGQMFAFTRLLKQILLEHTHNDDIGSIHVFTSSSPITKHEVFLLPGDRENSFKNSEIS